MEIRDFSIKMKNLEMNIGYDNANDEWIERIIENKLDNDYIGRIMISKYQFLKNICKWISMKIIRVKIFIFSKKSTDEDFILQTLYFQSTYFYFENPINSNSILSQRVFLPRDYVSCNS